MAAENSEEYILKYIKIENSSFNFVILFYSITVLLYL